MPAVVGPEIVQQHVIMVLAPIMIVKIAVMELVQDVRVVVQDVLPDVLDVVQDVLPDVLDVRILVKHYVTRVALIV